MARQKKFTQPLIHAMQIRRLCFFAGCIITGFGALAYRLVDLQVVQHDKLVEAAKRNTERTVVRHPKRGDIRDIRGNLLATSKIVHTVYADPNVLGENYTFVAEALSPLLDIPVEELRKKLSPRTRVAHDGSIKPVQYVVLKKKIEIEVWQAVQDAMKGLSFGIDETKLTRTQRAFYHRIRNSAVRNLPEEIRFYPNQTLAAHVVGFVGDREHPDENGHFDTTLIGKDGLEKSLNDVLTGVSGWRQIETDSRRREVVLFREQDVAPRSGLNAVLTIDSGVQHIVEDELAIAAARHTPISISCVVVRPKTGEIVAMATLPNFNPNSPGLAEMAELRNRVITDQAEPGSTFKIVVVAGGINEGKFDLHHVVDCENGRFFYAGRPLGEVHPFGLLTVEEIISKSSNIGSAKIGIALGKERLYDYVRAFGFGERTEIFLPGEIRGTVHKVPAWSGLSISRIPMGHEIACTPLQMVMAMSAIANRGLLMKPVLIDRLEDETGKTITKFQPIPVRQAVTEETALKLVQALKKGVSTNGTAAKAKLDFYTVAGKTGTAQKLVDGRYVRNKHFSSFIGFFPADDPELCISIVLDEPKKGMYGGETAAPVFHQIAKRAAQFLAIPPENPIPPKNTPDRTVAVTAAPRIR